MYNYKYLLFLMAISFLFSQCDSNKHLDTVSAVDVEKYSGKWYEIASFPQRFQKGCHNTTATYSMSPKGHLIVENSCNKDDINGPISYIKGKAFIVPNTGNAQLEVQFFWPFRGKYWIIELADDYSYAVVGHPNRKYLWILSRTSIMDEKIYNQLIEKIKFKGFNISLITKTVHG